MSLRMQSVAQPTTRARRKRVKCFGCPLNDLRTVAKLPTIVDACSRRRAPMIRQHINQRRTMKIGKLVQAYIDEIFAYCEKNPDELSNLMDKVYSKRKFGINYPFCMENKRATKKHARFWVRVYDVHGKTVRVCNDWYERNRNDFVDYLLSNKIVSNTEARNLLSDRTTDVPPVDANLLRGKKARPVKRAGGAPLANAQNAFVRYLLGNLGRESFSKDDWKKVVRFFGEKCAYCGGAAGKLEQDHAIPINRKHLGEHRLGNLAPACRTCNADKAGQDYREFLRDKKGEKTRLKKIAQHMNANGYVPLKDRDDFAQLQNIVEMAYTEINPLAKRYIAILNLMLDERR